MPHPVSRRIFAVGSTLSLASFAVGCMCGRPRSRSTRVGQVVRARAETTIDGAPLSLPEPGKVTVLDFWATWCEPCHLLMPELEKLWKQHAAAGLVVIGVEAGDAKGSVSRDVRRLGLTYATVIDDGGGIQRDYGVDSLPHTVVIDRHGRLRSEQEGMSSSIIRSIRKAAEDALKEA